MTRLEPGTVVFARLVVDAAGVSMPWGESVRLSAIGRDGKRDERGGWFYMDARNLVTVAEATKALAARAAGANGRPGGDGAASATPAQGNPAAEQGRGDGECSTR